MRSNQVLFSNQDASAVSSISSIVVAWRKAITGFQPGHSLWNAGGMWPRLLSFKVNGSKTCLFQKLLGVTQRPHPPSPPPKSLYKSVLPAEVHMVQGTGSGAELLGFEPQLCCLLVLWPWESYLTSLCSVSPFVNWGWQQYLQIGWLQGWVNAHKTLGTIFDIIVQKINNNYC